jgi:hypothetical protein
MSFSLEKKKSIFYLSLSFFLHRLLCAGPSPAAAEMPNYIAGGEETGPKERPIQPEIPADGCYYYYPH